MSTNGVGDAWVGNELRVVKSRGIPFALDALNPPRQSYFAAGDIADMARATTEIYPLRRRDAALAFAAGPARFGARFFAALWNALTGPRESYRNRAVGLWHFMVACHWAAGLRAREVHHIHSQWIHSAGTVAMYGAWLLDRPFSFTGHAADLFRERCALSDKIARAAFIVCISDFHRRFYIAQGADPGKLLIAYCGIDTSHFSPRRRVRPEGAPFEILSSGRLVEKKGFHVLIEACGILKARGLPFHCTIAGSGPLEADLRARISAAGLEREIEMTGTALKQEDIPRFMEGGDVYTLACVWAADNDVDGLPQMLMEAMACGLPAISTDLVGIPDLIRDEETGLLVPPEDATALADALMRLEKDPDLATRLAHQGRNRVVTAFDLDTCLDPLLNRFRAQLEHAS
jgi:glycosyltransferase involved in cell wall biosynthesis